MVAQLKDDLNKRLQRGGALIDIYTVSGNGQIARGVFDKIYQRILVSWNAMIKGYTRNNLTRITSPLVILLILNYIPNAPESYNFFHFASTTLELHNFTFCTFSLMQELEIDYRNRP